MPDQTQHTMPFCQPTSYAAIYNNRPMSMSYFVSTTSATDQGPNLQNFLRFS